LHNDHLVSYQNNDKYIKVLCNFILDVRGYSIKEQARDSKNSQ
ncbi:unnamed protein product, partial [marine sediment metagenome]